MKMSIAQKIIEHNFLALGEQVTQIDQFEEAIIVSSNNRNWRVEPLQSFRHFTKSDGYDLYNISQVILINSQAQPHGVAILPDNSLYYLNKDNEFRAFYKEVFTFIKPIELSALLTRYQGSGGKNHQNLILIKEELFDHLREEQIDAISDFIELQINKSSDKTLKMDFCSFFINRKPPDNIFRISINRWQLEDDILGNLMWSVQTIASQLDSLRYSRHSISRHNAIAHP